MGATRRPRGVGAVLVFRAFSGRREPLDPDRPARLPATEEGDYFGQRSRSLRHDGPRRGAQGTERRPPKPAQPMCSRESGMAGRRPPRWWPATGPTTAPSATSWRWTPTRAAMAGRSGAERSLACTSATRGAPAPGQTVAKLPVTDRVVFSGRRAPCLGGVVVVGRLAMLGFTIVEPPGLRPRGGRLYGADDRERPSLDLSTRLTPRRRPSARLASESLSGPGVRSRARDALRLATRPTDQLSRIDPASGAGTAIGPLGFAPVEGLEFDPSTGTLYGTDMLTGRLLAIDVLTGRRPRSAASGSPGSGARSRSEHGNALWRERHQRQSVDRRSIADREGVDRQGHGGSPSLERVSRWNRPPGGSSAWTPRRI